MHVKDKMALMIFKFSLPISFDVTPTFGRKSQKLNFLLWVAVKKYLIFKMSKGEYLKINSFLFR